MRPLLFAAVLTALCLGGCSKCDVPTWNGTGWSWAGLFAPATCKDDQTRR